MKTHKKLMVLTICVLLCMAVMGGTFGWYLYKAGEEKRAITDEAEVLAPYNLYLLKPNATDTLQFAVGNLHPGETKQTVICVSNKRPRDYDGDDTEDVAGLAKESEFAYDLMLVHTDNLAVEYQIYPLQKVGEDQKNDPDVIVTGDAASGTGTEGTAGDRLYWKKDGTTLDMQDQSEDMRVKAFGKTPDESIVNVGTYELYEGEKAANKAVMSLKYDSTGDTYEYDYYLIEVKWKKIEDFEAYKKETDLVYVVVNAKQPRPIEAQ